MMRTHWHAIDAYGDVRALAMGDGGALFLMAGSRLLQLAVTSTTDVGGHMCQNHATT